MSVDEDLIKSFIEKLSEELSTRELKTLKLQRCLMTFQQIQQRKQRVQNEESGDIEEKLIPILDPGTGRPMTPPRKQEVYDATVVEARKLLGVPIP